MDVPYILAVKAENQIDVSLDFYENRKEPVLVSCGKKIVVIIWEYCLKNVRIEKG